MAVAEGRLWPVGPDPATGPNAGVFAEITT